MDDVTIYVALLMGLRRNVLDICHSCVYIPRRGWKIFYLLALATHSHRYIYHDLEILVNVPIALAAFISVNI